MKNILLFASLLALAGASSAAAAADDGWYVRGELGQSSLNSNAFGGSNTDTSGNFRAGYYFNPHFAVEGFYSNYGSRSDGFGDKLSVDGWGLGVVAKQNFGPDNTGFFVQGRGGIVRVDSSLSLLGTHVGSDNATKGYIGAGTGYDFNHNVGIGLNYDYTAAGSHGWGGHIGTWTGGVEVRF